MHMCLVSSPRAPQAPGPLMQMQKLTRVPHLRQGDSGGPLVCGKGQVDGILSFSSKHCTGIFKPPVAIAVAPYSPWIRKIIRGWPHQPLD